MNAINEVENIHNCQKIPHNPLLKVKLALNIVFFSYLMRFISFDSVVFLIWLWVIRCAVCFRISHWISWLTTNSTILNERRGIDKEVNYIYWKNKKGDEDISEEKNDIIVRKWFFVFIWQEEKWSHVTRRFVGEVKLMNFPN